MKEDMRFIVALCATLAALISVGAFTLKYVVFPLFGA